ncbi:hypothetical protein MMC13_000213 [Lambiella insularis]|nr:hypothetical protein [Lambiella insularis]
MDTASKTNGRSYGLDTEVSTVPGVTKCLKAFQTLSNTADATVSTDRLSLRAATADCNGRFRVWSGNIGAHKTGKSSLDHRLRETAYIKTRVLRLLDDLCGLLNEAISIISGVRRPQETTISEEIDPDSGSDFEDGDTKPGQDTEIQQIFVEILELINCLYRLSMSVRNPTGTQRYIKSAHIDTSYFEPYDIEHVRQKFPLAWDYLVQRLGKAISRRRQYLKYRETHAAKIAQHLDEKDNTTVFSETTASDRVREEVKSVASGSSFATSVGSIQKARIPSMPKAAHSGLPFECPYCRAIECVNDTNAWIKHVHRDLQPYMCTFENCKTPNEMYEGRRQWFNHELQQHRRTWACNSHCRRKYASAEALITHVKKAMPGLYSNEQLPTLVEMWAAPIDVLTVSPCPLCGDEIAGTLQLQGHIGRHLEEIALFALPNDSTGSDEDEDNHASAANSDNASQLIHSDGEYHVTCDICQGDAKTHYHCSICSNNDFDMCKSCYRQGHWCTDTSHPMKKRSPQPNPPGQGLYYYTMNLPTHTFSLSPHRGEGGAAEESEVMRSDVGFPLEKLTEQSAVLDEEDIQEENAAPDHIEPETPKNALCTKIDRRLVNVEALKQGDERYTETFDHVIVLRV